jgi:hypothetical protein
LYFPLSSSLCFIFVRIIWRKLLLCWKILWSPCLSIWMPEIRVVWHFCELCLTLSYWHEISPNQFTLRLWTQRRLSIALRCAFIQQKATILLPYSNFNKTFLLFNFKCRTSLIKNRTCLIVKLYLETLEAFQVVRSRCFKRF